MNSSNSKCLISKNRFRDLNALLFAENIQFLSLTVNQDQTFFKNIKKNNNNNKKKTQKKLAHFLTYCVSFDLDN